MVTLSDLILQTITKPSDNFPTTFKETEFSTWGETLPQARSCGWLEGPLLLWRPSLLIPKLASPLPWPHRRGGQGRLCAAHRLCKSAGEHTSSNGAGKGPKLRLAGEPTKAGGGAQGCHTDCYGFHRSPVFQWGETLSFSFSPFLKGLHRRLQSRADTWDFCRWCNTKFTFTRLLLSVSLAIHHSNSQKNIYESGGWLFTISFFTPSWLSHILMHPLRKEGTEWDTSAENETLSPQKNYA